MSRTRSRWWWRALAALAVVGVLTGCVRIPDSGGVSTVAIPDEGDTEALLPVPEGPTVGATPQASACSHCARPISPISDDPGMAAMAALLDMF